MKGNDERPYAVIDVETTRIRSGQYPKTRFWGYADEKGYLRFETTNKLLTFLRRNPPHTLLHHSNFDVLQLLLDGANVQILRSHNSRLIRCKLYEQMLLNSYSVFPLPLAKIFSCFGFKKTPLACPLHSIEDGDDDERKEVAQIRCSACNSLLSERNRADCEDALVCFKKMDDIFVKLVGVSPLGRGTIAGTSFDAAKLVAGFKLPKDERFLEAYRGGRVEVFDTNQEICDKYDVNSSYPYAFLDCPPKANLLRVRVETRDFYCPLYHADTEDSLIFPNGKFESWVYEDNLERYLKPNWTKTKIKILQKETIDLGWLVGCRPLVEKLYRLKNESKVNNDLALQTVCKLLLNSLYGRIGLKGDSERARILDYRPDCGDGTLFKLGKRWLVFDTIQRPTQSNYPMAGYITDNARARLYRAFVGCGALYGDTDSAICRQGNDYFKQRETIGNDCGNWSYEGRELFQARNVKDYMWGEDEVRKGGDGYTQWTLKTMASGKPPTAIERERISELRKRTVLPSGVTVPLIIE